MHCGKWNKIQKLHTALSHVYGMMKKANYKDGEASLVVQMVKNLRAMQETHVPLLGWGDTLKKGRATHSSILSRRTPWTEVPGELVHGVAKSQTWLSD